jgi:hypothetical protein
MSEIYEGDAPEYGDVSIELLNQTVTRDVAVVELFVCIPGVFMGTVIGTAKRDPIDKPNEALSLHLAYGRAFQDISHKLLKRAKGLIKHQDDLRDKKSKPKGVIVDGPATITFPGVGSWQTTDTRGASWPTYTINFDSGRVEKNI